MQFLTLVVVLVLSDRRRFPAGPKPRLEGRRSEGAARCIPCQAITAITSRCGAALPALVLIAVWLSCEPFILESLIVDALPPEAKALSPARLSLLMNEVRQLGVKRRLLRMRRTPRQPWRPNNIAICAPPVSAPWPFWPCQRPSSAACSACATSNRICAPAIGWKGRSRSS